MNKDLKRRRSIYVVLFLLAIISGLFSRSSIITLPAFFAEYSGDTIWAAMVYFLFCCIFPKSQKRKLFVFAIIFSYAIEFSQLYHSGWIDNIRQYKIGGLILGFGFKFSDLICYTIGILIAAAVDSFVLVGVKANNTDSDTGC